MELYYYPLSCSAAARIVAAEAGVTLTLRRPDFYAKAADAPRAALRRLNPIEKVPTLVCDDGFVLTESVAVLLFLGDQAPPDRKLVPARDSRERYDAVRWLSFVATEVHKRVNSQVFAFEPAPDAVKQYAREGAAQSLGALDVHLREHDHLVGDTFTVCDAYLTWALALLPFAEVSLDPYPSVKRYQERHVVRESVAGILRAERREYRELAAARAG